MFKNGEWVYYIGYIIDIVMDFVLDWLNKWESDKLFMLMY